jgi:hypothetical protein
MQDVTLPISEHDSEQSDVDSDDAFQNVRAGTDHRDHDSNSESGLTSEDEDLDAAVRMLSNEVSSTSSWSTSLVLTKKSKVASLVTNDRKSQKSEGLAGCGAGPCISARDLKQATEVRTIEFNYSHHYR